jgi:hypothetical protein
MRRLIFPSKAMFGVGKQAKDSNPTVAFKIGICTHRLDLNLDHTLSVVSSLLNVTSGPLFQMPMLMRSSLHSVGEFPQLKLLTMVFLSLLNLIFYDN